MIQKHTATKRSRIFFSGKVLLFLGIALAQAKAAENTEIEKQENAEVHMAQSDWQGPGNAWFTDANWTALVPTDVAAFNTATPTSISINGGTATINELLFNPGASAYTLSIGNTGRLSLNGVGVTNNSSTVSTIAVAGGGILSFNGAATAPSIRVTLAIGGLLDISGASGDVTLGFATLAGSTALGSNQLIVGTLSLAGANLAGVISGTGGITTVGSSPMTVFGNHTYTGQTIFNSGTVTIGNVSNVANLTNSSGITIISGIVRFGGATSAGSLPIDVLNGSTFAVYDTVTLANSTTTLNSGSLVFFVTANGTSGTTINITSGSLLINSISATNVVIGTITSSSTGTIALGAKELRVGSSNASTTLAGAISGGGGSLTKEGTGTLTLTAVNTFTGTATVSDGILALSTAGILSTNSTLVSNSGGTFDISQITAASFTNGNVSGTGNFALGNKIFNVGVNVLGANSRTISGVISDGGIGGGTGAALTKQGTGILVLAGANSYTGLTTVSTGTLTLDTTGTIVGDSTVSLGATFNVDGTLSGSTLANAGTTSIGSSLGIITITNTNALNFTGSGTAASATVNHNGGTLNISGVTSSTSIGDLTGASSTASGAITLGSKELQIGALNQSSTISGAITDSGSGGSLTKQGSGTLTLTSASNNYIGTTTVSNGTLALLTAGTLSSNSALISNGSGIFDISQITPGSFTIGDVSGTGNFALGNKTFNVGANVSGVSTRTISGVISNGGIGGGTDAALTKQGTGILVLSGNNSYTGATTISAGTLALSGSGITSQTLLNSGTFDISGITASVSINDVSGAGGIALGNKTLILGAANATTTISGAIADGGISGGVGGSLTKEGSGTLTLTSGSNSYTGTTTISDGTLALSSAGILSSNSALAVNGSSIFDISQMTASALTIGDVSGAGDFALGSKTFNVGLNVTGLNNRTISGVISDGGIGGGTGASLTKQGSGILTLTGVNTYTGATTVSTGTLALATTGTLGINSALLTSSGAVFDISQITPASFVVGDASGAGGFALGDKTFIIGATITGADSRTISGAISDGGIGGGTGANLTKQGTGTLILSGINTYTGLTTVSAGTLTLDSSGVIVSDTSVSSGAIFNVNGTFNGNTITNAGTTNIASVLGAVTITNTEFLNFLGSGTEMNGTVNHNGGILDISGVTTSTSIGNLTGTGNTASGAVVLGSKTLQVGSLDQSSTISGIISGVGGSLIKEGTGVLTLTGVNTYSGSTTISSGTLALSVAGTISSTSALMANAGSTFDISQITPASISIGSVSGSGNFALGNKTFVVGSAISGATSRTISGIISDGGIGGGTGASLTKEGTGILILSGVNTYTGLTTVSAGTLTLNAIGTIAGDSTVSLGAIFNVNGTLTGSALSNAGTTNIASVLGIITVINTNLLNFTGSGTGPNATVNHNGGTLNISGVTTSASIGNLTGTANIASGAITLGNKTLEVGSLNQSATISGAITGTGGSFTKQGGGTLTLTSASNNYTGTTTVSAGTLALATTGTLSSSSALAVNGGIFDISQITAGALTINDVSGAGNFNLGNKTFNIGAGVTGVGTRTISGVIADGGIGGGTGANLVKQGTGLLTLTGVNTFTGSTTVSAGTLALATTGSLSNSSSLVANSSAIFDISQITAGSLTLGDVSGAGNFALGSKTFIIGANVAGADSRTISGVISNGGIGGGSGGALTKEGTGILVLSGANTYTGLTSVSAGTLTLDATGTIAGNSTVDSGATFNVNGALGGSALSNAGTTTIASILGVITITNTNALNFIGSGTGTNATVNHNGGTLDISGATSSVNIGNLTGTANIASGDVNLGNKTLLTGVLNQSSTLAGTIAGSGGSLTKQGSGTLTLTGVNTYTGTTTVSTGTLALATAGSLSSNSALVASSGAVFDISQITAGSLTVGDASGAGSFALGSKTFIIGANVSGANSRTISGVISDGGIGGGTGAGLTKQGTGILILSGANTYTGLTTVSAGTLTLNASGTIAGNSTVSSGATFNVNGTLGGSALTNAGTTNIASVLGTITITNTNLLNFTNNSNATNTTINHNGGTLNISGVTSSINIGNLTGTANIASGDVNLGNKTLLTGGLNQSSAISGAITGAGGNLIKQGSGTLTLTSGGNNYTGTTTISSGIVAISGSGILSEDSALVVNSGTQFTISSMTAGSLAIGDVSGAGLFSLGNKNLIVGSNVNGSGTRTISGVISGAGGQLTKEGTGTLILTAENTYTGLTTVGNGILQLGLFSWSGGFTVLGDLTVNPGAFLIGYGSVGGSINNFGTVAPGNNDIGGNLTVAGNYIQSPTGTFLADIDDNGVPSVLYVGGQAQLNNGIFGINMLGSGYTAETSYTAIYADGGVVGEFGTILQSGFLYLYVDYFPNEVLYHLSLVGPTTFLLDVANTPNQIRAAEYLVATGGDAAVITALVRIRTVEQARAFLDSFSAATYANQTVALAKVGQSFETEMADRIDGYASCYMKQFRFPEESELQERTCKGVSWWGVLYGQENQIAGTDVSGLTTYSSGLAIGTEILSDENLLIGFAGSYNYLHSTAFGREHAHAKGGLYQFGVYGRQEWGNLRLGGSADYGMTNTISATRDIFTARGPVPVTGNYTAKMLSTQIRANYDLPIAAEVGVRPLLGTIYQHVWRNPFTENSNTGFELNVNNANYNSWRAQFGFDLELYAYERFYPFASVIWEYEMADQYGKMVGSLVGLSDVFYALGTEIGRDAIVVKAGFLLTRHKDWDLLVEYEGRYAQDFMQRGIKMELSYF